MRARVSLWTGRGLPLVVGLAVALGAGLLLGAQPARAARVAGVDYAESLAAGDVRLALYSTGVFRWKGLLKAYTAALYLGRDEDAGRVFEDVPKRLELHYFYAIEGAAFGPAAEAVLERSFAPEVLAPLHERIAALHRLYEDVEPGDRYALTYVPGRGTELSMNGRPLGVIAGADFARAYFAIWLGEAPLDRHLRDQLLPSRSGPP